MKPLRSSRTPRGDVLPRRTFSALGWLSSTAGRLGGSHARPGHGTALRGATRPPLPRPGGSVDRRDRSSAGTRTSNHQGVSLRSNRRQGTRGQGALPGSVSRLRGAHHGTARATPTRIANAAIPGAIAPRWTRERVREAMRAWRARYGAAPSSYDWSRTYARRRGAEALIGHPRCGAAVVASASTAAGRGPRSACPRWRASLRPAPLGGGEVPQADVLCQPW